MTEFKDKKKALLDFRDKFTKKDRFVYGTTTDKGYDLRVFIRKAPGVLEKDVEQFISDVYDQAFDEGMRLNEEANKAIKELKEK